jgi:hypothetical protein
MGLFLKSVFLGLDDPELGELDGRIAKALANPLYESPQATN